MITMDHCLELARSKNRSMLDADYFYGASDLLDLFRQVEAETIAKCAQQVPTNWLDPLLTGKDGISGPPYGCREIEKLLRGIQDRIRALQPIEQGRKEDSNV